MSPPEYSLLFKHVLDVGQAQFCSFSCDLFISAFNPSERVSSVWAKVRATEKHWLIHNEYGYSATELPTGLTFTDTSANEADFVLAYLDWVNSRGAVLERCSICVDITGFMRPHLLFLVSEFERRGVKRFDALYSEPVRYLDREETVFAVGAVSVVRQVASFEGVASRDSSNDLLIIGAGYDHQLISEVAEHKERAAKIQLFGLPSLRADMYQENVLRAYRAEESLGEAQDAASTKYFAPANDPFVTASILSEIVRRRDGIKKITNLYLSPLATKPQALGFALFYIGECRRRAASMLFPYSPRYSKETSVGLMRCWRYEVEFPLA